VAHSEAPPQDGRASLSAQSGNGAIITPTRRFPPSWIVEEHNNACFIVKDATGQAIGVCLPSEVNDLTWPRLPGAALDP